MLISEEKKIQCYIHVLPNKLQHILLQNLLYKKNCLHRYLQELEWSENY